MIFWLIAEWLGAGMLISTAIFLMCLLGAFLMSLLLGPLRKPRTFEPDPWIDHPRA